VAAVPRQRVEAASRGRHNIRLQVTAWFDRTTSRFALDHESSSSPPIFWKQGCGRHMFLEARMWTAHVALYRLCTLLGAATRISPATRYVITLAAGTHAEDVCDALLRCFRCSAASSSTLNNLSCQPVFIYDPVMHCCPQGTALLMPERSSPHYTLVVCW
jgi:hypothetical protein